MLIEVGNKAFDVTYRALVMGILNRTPDSFYDGGRYWDFDQFLRQAELLVTQGADLLDVGGVRAGPGPEVTPEEECQRVVSAIAALHQRFDIPLSVDTFRACVFQEAIKAGAQMGNDISGFADPEYLKVAATYGASVVATHVRIGPRIADPNPTYTDVRHDVARYLLTRANAALAAGIPRNRVIIDAGLDLGKTPQMSVELMQHSHELVALGFTVLLSASNKGFLGELTNTTVENRGYASLGAHGLGIIAGCRVLRVHDVAATRRMADCISLLLQNRREGAAGFAGIAGFAGVAYTRKTR